MATQIAKCLVPVLITALFLTLASSNAPFIVAHKKATLTRLKSGVECVSASIDIYNQGSATAYDVSLTDDSWSKDVFHIFSGNTSMSWERHDVGALVSHAFELESKYYKHCSMVHQQLSHSTSHKGCSTGGLFDSNSAFRYPRRQTSGEKV